MTFASSRNRSATSGGPELDLELTLPIDRQISEEPPVDECEVPGRVRITQAGVEEPLLDTDVNCGDLIEYECPAGGGDCFPNITNFGFWASENEEDPYAPFSYSLDTISFPVDAAGAPNGDPWLAVAGLEGQLCSGCTVTFSGVFTPEDPYAAAFEVNVIVTDNVWVAGLDPSIFSYNKGTYAVTVTVMCDGELHYTKTITLVIFEDGYV